MCSQNLKQIIRNILGNFGSRSVTIWKKSEKHCCKTGNCEGTDSCTYKREEKTVEKQELHIIDFEAAKAAFETYLDEYDRTDDKIHLKIVHTYCVVECAEKIATRMHLGQEDVQLTKIIGLLHDIGRFEQIRRFHSFEPGTMDHAVYGAELLDRRK